MHALLVAFALLLSVISLGARPAWSASGATTRVSVDSAAAQGNGESFDPDTSADGRFVAFTSSAPNLVTGDTNGALDVFLNDRHTGATTRVSVGAGGQANGDSFDAALSSDARYVAFYSSASNLVAGDTNGTWDIFVHDRNTGATSRVSVDSAGSQGNAPSFGPAISGDGRFVAFWSHASNLVAGDTNGSPDVFVHDRQTGEASRVSVDSAGAQANADSIDPAISAGGRYVAFHSGASNLVAGDTNGSPDVFVHDRQTGETSRVSVGSTGSQGNANSFSPAISADGRYVAFHSWASNLVAGDTNDGGDVFVHDRQTGETSRVSVDSAGAQGEAESSNAAISGDGRLVAFWSAASNLVAGDTNDARDVFVHDRQTGATSRVSVDSSGGQGNENSHNPALSADGSYIAFDSRASNLVAGDTNGTVDVFVHGLSSTDTPPSDTTPPAAPAVSLADPVNATNQSAATVSGTGEAGTTANISVDDEDSETVAVTATAAVSESGYSATLDLSSLSDGTLTATVTLTDAAGNTGPAGTGTATKDTVAPTAPTVALTDPVTPRNQAAVTVSGTGEAGTTAHISVDDDDPATAAVTTTAPVSGSGYSATLDLSSLSNGTLTATVSLTDAAGNTGPAGTDTARKMGPPVDRGPGRGRP